MSRIGWRLCKGAAEKRSGRIAKASPVETADREESSSQNPRRSPFSEIIRYARDKSIDLIVIGTHGRTGLAHVLMGSVAENVVRMAGRPVLTVWPAGHQFRMP